MKKAYKRPQIKVRTITVECILAGSDTPVATEQNNYSSSSSSSETTVNDNVSTGVDDGSSGWSAKSNSFWSGDE
jgi:hypothetical protein